MKMDRAALLLSGISAAAGHGAMVIPPTRNAVEALQGVPAYLAGDGACPCANGAVEGTNDRDCANANACYWFSQGCTIGCDECDGTTTKFKDICGSGKKYTISDPALRTFARDAEAGSAADKYQHHPWRAPGTAPTLDPCGMAGGSPLTYSTDGAMYPGDWDGGASHPGPLTGYAKHNDLGSKLPEAPLQQWTRGTEVEVAWTIEFNHGGGYQYRLCPKSEPLSEACFEKMPLEWGKQFLRFSNKTMVEIQGTYVSEGTVPAGSTWAMNPIPAAGRNGEAMPFDPPCDEGGVPGVCSGDTARWPNHLGLQIVDKVKLPSDLELGEYVLQWRWDCEGSAQVWTNCADVAIGSGTPSPPAFSKAQVTFGPYADSVAPPADWLPDSGESYALRNGLRYGWDRDLEADTRDRGSNTLQSTLLAPCNKVQGCEPAAAWRMEVPDGNYKVTVVYGDEGSDGHTDGCTLQGASAGVGFLKKGEEKSFEWTGAVSGVVEFKGSWGKNESPTTCHGINRIVVEAVEKVLQV